jgi:hypothetical protein
MDELFHRKFIEKLLASRKAEALAWLNSPSSFRNLGELARTEASVTFVKRIYSLGAIKVLAVEIIDYPEGENTGKLLVELPEDRFLRGELFAFEREFAESMGFDGTADEGQRYLFLKLD